MNTQIQQIEQTIQRSPSLIGKLSGYALARHGWGDSDGGFGVTYSTDLDEYDRHVDGIEIPNGHVLLYGFGGPPDGYEFVISEAEYIASLLRILSQDIVGSDAAVLKSLQQSLEPIT